MYDHLILSRVKCLITIGSFIISSSLKALLKVLALSDITKEGIDLRATYLLKHLRNAAAVRFGTTSKCTALVMQHVNKHIHTFRSFSLEDLT